MALPVIDWDMSDDDFNAIYNVLPGEIIKYTKNYESLMLRIQRDIPDTLTSFKVREVVPGMECYSLYAPNALIVVERIPITGD